MLTRWSRLGVRCRNSVSSRQPLPHPQSSKHRVPRILSTLKHNQEPPWCSDVIALTESHTLHFVPNAYLDCILFASDAIDHTPTLRYVNPR